MRVIVFVKANQGYEKGEMLKEKLLAAKGKYNEELVKGGIMIACDGLHPSGKGKRVNFSENKRTVIDGPFAETKELVACYCEVERQRKAWAWPVHKSGPMLPSSAT